MKLGRMKTAKRSALTHTSDSLQMRLGPDFSIASRQTDSALGVAERRRNFLPHKCAEA